MPAKRQKRNKRPSRAKTLPTTPHGTKKKSGRKWLWRGVTIIFILAASVSLYIVYLDNIVTKKFSSSKWSLPARVYGQSQILRRDMHLSARTLGQQLRHQGYRHDRLASTAGSFSIHKQQMRISRRSYYAADGHYHPTRMIQLRFDQQYVREIRVNGKTVTHITLDPPLLGIIGFQEDRLIVSYKQIPKYLKQALIATEDKNFYYHFGIDPKSILRALYYNLKSGRIVQGGSTLTQQLVKNFFLDNRKSLLRKINEALMAMILEYHYSKQQILTAYVNQVYLGQDKNRAIHGFSLAAREFFRRELGQLSLAQIATLTAMVKGPNFYQPRRHPKRAKQRRNYVLERMFEQGYITARQKQKAQQAILGIREPLSLAKNYYPAFMQWITGQLRAHFSYRQLQTRGLNIYTTYQPWLHAQVLRALQNTLPALQKKSPVRLQTALVISQRNNAQIVVMIGDKNSRDPFFNRAVDSHRPVGSIIKPAIYLTALKQGYSPRDVISDQSVRVKLPDGNLWKPQNFDHRSHGRVSLTQALAHSYNQASVRLGMHLELAPIIQTIHLSGIQTPIQPMPSLLLGALSLSPLQVTQMYQTIADQGWYQPLHGLISVLDNKHRPLYQQTIQKSLHFKPHAMRQLLTMLQQVPAQGSARALRHLYPQWRQIAAKTGTSNDFRDSWFAAIHPDYVIINWLGNDHNQPTGFSGADGAMKIVASVLQSL